MNTNEQDILKGATIILTYPENDQYELSQILQEAGAVVLSMPMIAIEPIPFKLKKDIATYDWLVFTSKNAVDPFFDQYTAASGNHIAALGPGTAASLNRRNLPVSFTGTSKTAVHFSEELLPVIHPHKSVLLVLGTLAPDTLENTLSTTHPVERINVYTTVMPRQVDPALMKRIDDGCYDFLVVSSPSAIRNLAKLLPGKENIRIFSIGQTTTAAIRELRMEPLATASDPGYGGLARTIISYYKNNPKNNTP
ncbi:MAG: uroporphyrinogen-III synthase [Prolixibacteraceae bacterium]